MRDDVKLFFDAVPPERRPLFDRLHALILSLYPQADIVLSYGVPTYRVKPGWVALGYRKGYVSIYTNGPHHLAEFKAKCPGVKTGMGCINLKLDEKVPLAALKQVIKHAIEHPKP
jgi:hypothetical protein